MAEAEAQLRRTAADFIAVQSQVLAAIDTAMATQTASDAQLRQARRLRVEVEKQCAPAQQELDLGAADQVERQTVRLDAVVANLAVLDAENSAAVATGQLEDALQVPFTNLDKLAERTRPTQVTNVR